VAFSKLLDVGPIGHSHTNWNMTLPFCILDYQLIICFLICAIWISVREMSIFMWGDASTFADLQLHRPCVPNCSTYSWRFLFSDLSVGNKLSVFRDRSINLSRRIGRQRGSLKFYLWVSTLKTFAFFGSEDSDSAQCWVRFSSGFLQFTNQNEWILIFN
jgi:hypothetical protein